MSELDWISILYERAVGLHQTVKSVDAGITHARPNVANNDSSSLFSTTKGRFPTKSLSLRNEASVSSIDMRNGCNAILYYKIVFAAMIKVK